MAGTDAFTLLPVLAGNCRVAQGTRAAALAPPLRHLLKGPAAELGTRLSRPRTAPKVLSAERRRECWEQRGHARRQHFISPKDTPD